MDGDVTRWLETEPAAGLRAEVTTRMEALDPHQVATVIYTSGTTGEPKGVMLTHHNFVEMAKRSLQVFPVTENDVILSWMPYSHVYERMDGIFIETMAGATIWLNRGMERLVEDISIVSPTLMCGVPRVFEKMNRGLYDRVAHETRLKRALFDWAMRVGARRLHGGRGAILGAQARLADRLVLRKLHQRLTGGRLRCFFSGGAPLNPKVEDFFWILGVRILQGWGLTESTSGATTNTETVHRYHTVGKPIPGTEVRIAADGEILLRGPGMMVGYKNKPEATAATIVDGWLQTGDIGFLDEDGFLTITDRKKDLIKTAGGKYVAPLALEAKLQADRFVKAATVVGEGRPYVVALIVPDWDALAMHQGFTGDPGQLVSDQRLLAFFKPRVEMVNKELASYETIKHFALLPREFSEACGELTPSFKTRRKVIEQNFLPEIEELYRRRRET
jgi:long-chain acyl-CoA synthetase